MMQRLVPLTRDLVFVGGGHAHALALRSWGMDPVPGVRVTLIDPNPTAPYTGMLPGHIAGHYPREALEIDLVQLSAFAGARFIQGRVTQIDPVAQQITVPGRPPIWYDTASIDIGITSSMPEIPGFRDFATSAKPLGGFAARWRQHLAQVAEGVSPACLVIGGGVAGVELALAMDHALRAAGAPPGQVTVVEAAQALSVLPPRSSRALRAHLDRASIRVIEEATVTQITQDAAHLSDGQVLSTRLVVGAAGARPYPWLEQSGLALRDGFIQVDKTLRSLSHPTLYAVGDCAHMVDTPRPKAGVFAVRQAPILLNNLRADLAGGDRRIYLPQADYLKLISLGGRSALADKVGLTVQGRWLWRLKDKIDRDFMAKFVDLPQMGGHLPAIVAKGVRDQDQPLCGGCGAKVGRDVLSPAIAGVGQGFDLGPGDDAAVWAVGDQQVILTTDHLRAVTPDPYVQARVTALHALGDIWAMGARPEAVLVTLILPDQTPALQSRSLVDAMAGLTDALSGTGAQIAGGHTMMGAELSVGLSIAGRPAAQPITLAGAQPGDLLVLTRPLGSGVVLAGGMQGKVGGDQIAACLSLLQASQQDIALALAQQAHAMTDVTGFGLAGHAWAMAQASDTAVRLDPACVPALPGALAAMEVGVRASLHPGNVASVPRATPQTAAEHLLFDPQTAGGFLAAVPQDAVADLGDAVWVVGRVEAGPAALTFGQVE